MAKEKSLPLHPKYGVNPTIPVCMYCGKERNEIAMLGNLCKTEAPHRALIDREPCEECRNIMDQCFMLIEVRDGEYGSDNPFRTGYIVGLDYARAYEIFPKMQQGNTCCFIEQHVLKAVLGDMYRKEI